MGHSHRDWRSHGLTVADCSGTRVSTVRVSRSHGCEPAATSSAVTPHLKLSVDAVSPNVLPVPSTPNVLQVPTIHCAAIRSLLLPHDQRDVEAFLGTHTRTFWKRRVVTAPVVVFTGTAWHAVAAGRGLYSPDNQMASSAAQKPRKIAITTAGMDMMCGWCTRNGPRPTATKGSG